MPRIRTKLCQSCGKPFHYEDPSDTVCDDCFGQRMELYHTDPITDVIQ